MQMQNTALRIAAASMQSVPQPDCHQRSTCLSRNAAGENIDRYLAPDKSGDSQILSSFLW